MLHSGSRSLGKTICDAFHKLALAENRRWHSTLPHQELAYLPVGTDGFVGYWAAMTFALRFAEVNRSRMLDVVEAAFGAHTRVGRFERVVDVHHNYAAWDWRPLSDLSRRAERRVDSEPCRGSLPSD
jgi:tRNA-splicing ligase RtcB (3'-phosphate/5'-hydroxy nucleic acid ligase)